MNDLFALPANPEAIYSKRLRVHMVDGDGMEPDLRSRRDYVLIAPVDGYCGEGIYLIEVGGGQTLYRVQNILTGLRLKLDNPVYGDSGVVVTREQFAEDVLGFVVADIKVRDERFLRQH